MRQPIDGVNSGQGKSDQYFKGNMDAELSTGIVLIKLKKWKFFL